MAVQPLNKIKIIKKVTKHPARFQSHQFMRLNVSQWSSIRLPVLLSQLFVPTEQNGKMIAFLIANLCVFRLHGEDQEVSTTLSAVATVVGALCHKLVKSRPRLLATCFQAVLESFWSETRKTLNCCSWTTELTLVRSLKASQPPREQELSLAQKNSTSDSPTDRLSSRRSPLNEHSDCSNILSEVIRATRRKILARARVDWLAVRTRTQILIWRLRPF